MDGLTEGAEDGILLVSYYRNAFYTASVLPLLESRGFEGTIWIQVFRKTLYNIQESIITLESK